MKRLFPTNQGCFACKFTWNDCFLPGQAGMLANKYKTTVSFQSSQGNNY
jgi:hypothetical protein